MEFVNFDLYLFYNLEIEPQDIGSTKIKNNINFKKIIEKYDVIVNDKENLYLSNMIIDDELIDSCYIEYFEDNYFIRIQFYKINNSELLTPNFIKDSKYILLKTAIKRHIELVNNPIQFFPSLTITRPNIPFNACKAVATERIINTPASDLYSSLYIIIIFSE